MSGFLRVVHPGLQTTVQDLGRMGAQRLGIPVSGALDATSLRASNAVVGNPAGAAALEMTALGPTLEIDADSVRIAIAGGNSKVVVERKDGRVETVQALRSVRVQRGERVRVPAISGSSVAYLAIEGGMALTPFMGSYATYVRGGFGGFQGRALASGDAIPLNRPTVEDRPEQMLADYSLLPQSEVRVVLGPQDDYFGTDAIATLLSSPYRVTREADRMGLRLEGPPLEHAKGYNIVSDGIAPGSIQVPGSRQPIVLLADRQTTGGYPKIATVISADLPAMGRLVPGSPISFRAVTIAEAEALRRARVMEWGGLPGRLQVVRPEGLDLEILLSANLVSGVTAGDHVEP